MRNPTLRNVLMVAALFGITFQVGHFIEHVVQFGVWLFNDHSKPYMSPWVMWMTNELGQSLFPQAIAQRQMMMGMEILHLIGNSIFLATIGCLFCCVPDKLIKLALIVEAAHLYEHLTLVLTALYRHEPLGMSNLFGGAMVIGGREFAVGYRVTWHFVMNLVPTALIMMSIMRRMRKDENSFAFFLLAK